MSVSPFDGAFADNPRASSTLGQALRREGIAATQEFKRIAALPTRTLENSIDVDALSAMLRLPDGHPNKCKGNCGSKYCVNGNLSLFPDQAYALKEMVDVGGAFVGTDVGSGKSLMILLGAVVTRAKRPLVIMPANARKGFEEVMIPFMAKHFRLPENLMIASYESLSTKNNKDFLTSRMPDWVFADEAHKLKNEDISRALRFMRFFDEFTDTHLAAFSGSFFDREITSFAHILYLCLRHSPHGGAPIPYDRQPTPDGKSKRNVHADELLKWGKALNSDVEADDRYAGGALLEFTRYLSTEQKACDDLKLVQRAFGARLRLTPGVVFSSTPASTLPIKITELPVTVPPKIRDAFEVLRDTWETPGDTPDVISDAAQLYATVRQLAQGFFYRWVWPVNPITGKEEKDLIWLDARRNWHRRVRGQIAHSRGAFDSKAEVEEACERYEAFTLARQVGQRDIVEKLRGTRMVDSQEYRNWQKVKGRYKPVTETIWIDNFLVDRVAEWLDVRPGIAWVESNAMGEAIRRKGFRYYRGGENEIIYETVSCAASIKAHGTAKNLQHYDRGLVVTPPTKGLEWEQLIGRFDRTGQESSEITIDLFLHARELWAGFYKARLDASFAEAPGTPQKLCRAQIALALDVDAYGLKTFGDDPLWKFNRAA